MSQFDEIFNKASIYDMLFINVKPVLIHKSLYDLFINDKPMFERWAYISKTKFKFDVTDKVKPIPDIITSNDESILVVQNDIYLKNAVYYPEYTRILSISYAILHMDNGQKRDMKIITNDNERIVIETFLTDLILISEARKEAKKESLYTLCGFNISTHDIPLLIKRFMVYRDKDDDVEQFITVKELPLIIKKSLSIKPWESGLIDTANIWKFNGYNDAPLMLIADFLKLKKVDELLPLNELSEYYWKNIELNREDTLDFIGMQSATQMNFSIQMMNIFRKI